MAGSPDIEKFRQIIGEAPELSEPFKVGNEQLPYSVYEIDEKIGKGVIETKPQVSGRFFRVEYDKVYGLKVKRFLSLRHIQDDEPVMDYGGVFYSKDNLNIVLAANYDSPLLPPEMIKEFLSDPNNFNVSIQVCSKDAGGDNPPLARVCYGYDSQIPIQADFLYADYQDALKGNVERYDQGKFTTPRYHYRKTYFQWENLVGVKVGFERFEEGINRLQFYRWVTQINNPTTQVLEGTPYKEKITRVEGRQWRRGRLRFSRMNTETGESWFFSVSEWINNRDFIRDVESQNLMDFIHSYPVVFCIKNQGASRQWFSTTYKNDKSR